MEAELQTDLEAQLERLAQMPPEQRIVVLEELEARLRAELDTDDEG